MDLIQIGIIVAFERDKIICSGRCDGVEDSEIKHIVLILWCNKHWF